MERPLLHESSALCLCLVNILVLLSVYSGATNLFCWWLVSMLLTSWCEAPRQTAEYAAMLLLTNSRLYIVVVLSSAAALPSFKDVWFVMIWRLQSSCDKLPFAQPQKGWVTGLPGRMMRRVAVQVPEDADVPPPG